MKTRSLVIVTTRLPPQACGIGTYSWLAHQHRPKDSVPAEFLVMEGADESRSFLHRNGITNFHGDPASLSQALFRSGPANVLLHYAGRAYQRFGCPIWMPGVFARWKARFPEGRLTIFFHELPGKLPYHSRHFFLEKINARIVRQLCALADALVTNTENHVAILRHLSGCEEINFLPVGSNIEAVTPSLESRIKTEFIIFGLPFGRLQTLRLFEPEIRRWQEGGSLTVLHLIGPEDQKFGTEARELVERWPQPGMVVRHGLLPDAEVWRLFAQAQFALTNVTSETWSKSGAFMTCAVTGCAPVIKEEQSRVIPLSYAILSREVERISEVDLANRTNALKAWYHQHADWNVTAGRLASLSELEERGA